MPTTEYKRVKHAQRSTEAAAIANVKTREQRLAADTKRWISKLEDGTQILEGGSSTRYVERFGTLAAALTAFGATNIDACISSTITLTANTTIPTNVALRFRMGGKIDTNGFTLRINGSMPAERFQVFSGAGAVTFGPQAVKAVFPEWWGAVAEVTAGTTDSADAIQKAAVSARASETELNFGPGTYHISSGISITGDGAPIRWVGQGKYYTYIMATVGSSFTTLLSLTDTDVPATALTYTNYAARSIIDGVSFEGGGVHDAGTGVISTASRAQYGIKAVTNHLTLRDCRVKGTGTCGFDIACGWDNNYIDCEASANQGDGFRQNRNDNNNGTSYWHCDSFANRGYGYRIKSGVGLHIAGAGAVEQNRKAGIYLEASVRGYRIDAMYYESNAGDGHTFTHEGTSGGGGVDITDIVIKADILICGGAEPEAISNANYCSGVVSGSQVSLGGAAYHIYCPGQAGLVVYGCCLNSGDTGALVGTYGNSSTTSPENSWASLQNIHLFGNRGWGTAASPTLTLDVAGSSPKFPGTTTLGFDVIKSNATNTFISDAANRNIAQTDFTQWSLISAVSGGTFARSAEVFPYDAQADVYELALATVNASDTYGFSFNAANYTAYHGKLFQAAIWMKHTEAADISGALLMNPQGTSRIVPMDYRVATDVGWQLISCAFIFPTSGTVTFTVQKIVQGAGANGTIYFANPILAEVGSDFHNLQGRRGLLSGDYVKYYSGIPGVNTTSPIGTMEIKAAASNAMVRSTSKTAGSYSAFGLRDGAAAADRAYLAYVETAGQWNSNSQVGDLSLVNNQSGKRVVLGNLANADASVIIGSDHNVLFSGRIQKKKAADLASANDITIGVGNFANITGTTQINRITTTGWQAGSEITLKFTDSVTVAHQGAATSGALARLNLAGAANFSATVNDTLKLVYDGTDWFEVSRTVI